jgi:hypothetical protein
MSQKNSKIFYYLLIISNLVLKLFIAIYFILCYFFQFHPLKFNFYINLGFRSFNCYLFFLFIFLINFFYLLDPVHNLLILFILFEVIYGTIIIFNFFICQIWSLLF